MQPTTGAARGTAAEQGARTQRRRRTSASAVAKVSVGLEVVERLGGIGVRATALVVVVDGQTQLHKHRLRRFQLREYLI
jgi:hypothetical protein